MSFDFDGVFRAAATNLSRLGPDYVASVAAATDLLEAAFRADRKLLVFGNGGSSADAQHIVAELVGRFLRERRALPAVALTTNQAMLTAWSNDAGYEDVFARQVEGLGRRDDVAWGISTSGNSANVINGLTRARALGLRTIGLTGKDGGRMAPLCDVLIAVPLIDTPRIQEVHLVTYHAICAALEERLFASSSESSQVVLMAEYVLPLGNPSTDQHQCQQYRGKGEQAETVDHAEPRPGLFQAMCHRHDVDAGHDHAPFDQSDTARAVVTPLSGNSAVPESMAVCRRCGSIRTHILTGSTWERLLARLLGQSVLACNRCGWSGRVKLLPSADGGSGESPGSHRRRRRSEPELEREPVTEIDLDALDRGLGDEPPKGLKL